MFDDAIELGVQTFLAFPDESDSALEDRLVSLGLAPFLARRVVCWLPSAFGRAMLRDANFGDTYSDGSVQRVLMNDPVFVVARTRAALMNHDEATCIALRSAEVNVANQFLHSAHEQGRPAQLADIHEFALALVDPLPPMESGHGGAPEPREAFAAFLEGHGLTVRRELPWTVWVGPYAHEARVFPWWQDGRLSLQVDFVVRGPGIAGGRICESFGGFGNSYADRVGDAVQKFERGSFHVLLAALHASGACADQVEWEHWSHPSGGLRVCLGPQLRLYSNPDVTLRPLLDRLRDALADVSLTREYHVLRVYVAGHGAQEPTTEVLLDGEPWEAGDALARSCAWPSVNELWGVRCFMVLLPDPP